MVLFSVTVYSLKEQDNGTLVCARSHTVSRVFYVSFYLLPLQFASMEHQRQGLSMGSGSAFVLCVTLNKGFTGYQVSTVLPPQQVQFICCGLPSLFPGRLELEASLIETWKSHRLPDLLFHEGISKT